MVPIRLHFQSSRTSLLDSKLELPEEPELLIRRPQRLPGSGLGVVIAVIAMSLASAALAYAKAKKDSASPDDPTYQMYQLLDNSYGGELTDFCLLADTYTNPAQGGQVFEHVLQVDYDKSRFFGRFRIYVRGVSQLTPGQLKAYTPEQIYSFGSDVEKFEKISPGPFGEAGDVYVRATTSGLLAPVPITDEARKEYEFFLARYIVPALEKQASIARSVAPEGA